MDELGPGSKVWKHADNAAYHFDCGHKNAAFCAQRRMIRELRLVGVSEAYIEAWKADIKQNPIE